MGIELDVLVGHPEHDLLFVATQVARAAGLKDPSASVSVFRNANLGIAGAFQWRGIVQALNQIQDQQHAIHGKVLNQIQGQIPGQPTARSLQANSWMATEGWVYRMLMRGDSKSAADFRTWLADEVVPTIRKTGKYDAEESTNPAVLRT
jgi:prophage antirepressor-like protein